MVEDLRKAKDDRNALTKENKYVAWLTRYLQELFLMVSFRM